MNSIPVKFLQWLPGLSSLYFNINFVKYRNFCDVDVLKILMQKMTNFIFL